MYLNFVPLITVSTIEYFVPAPLLILTLLAVTSTVFEVEVEVESLFNFEYLLLTYLVLPLYLTLYHPLLHVDIYSSFVPFLTVPAIEYFVLDPVLTLRASHVTSTTLLLLTLLASTFSFIAIVGIILVANIPTAIPLEIVFVFLLKIIFHTSPQSVTFFVTLL
ncbi:hypothetical protein SDC9_141972 [bioreactor metagenome]|uniref:Uncharacterized protein n=1 Tax=bioreactor metagenome TaxID=1076179 RepID=A0A645DZ67_9ZZZZ